MPSFTKLAISDTEQFYFGTSPRPVTTRSGLVIGGGTVYPELNFTLPPMAIEASTMVDVRAQYTEMIDSAAARAVELHAPGLVVEFELLPELTREPEWGAEITTILADTLRRYADKGLKSALRVTPNDVREFARPPILREGELWDAMVRSFDLCAAAGADLLAIESTGGKEVHDEALLNADVPGIVFALGILGAADMAFLWDMIVRVAGEHGAIASGDTACGFGNTAMVLAEQRHIPRVLGALVRVLTVPRSLVAYERGAVGPSKDCAYEGPFLKAITGCPIALEGAEAACAHLSPVGNVAKATADLWSNELVQNVKLLSAMAPTVSLEQLVYAVRLMNRASASGPDGARTLRDWFVESDSTFDPQAYLLRPDVVLCLSGAIIEETTPYRRTRRAGLETMAMLRKAVADGDLTLNPLERKWLDRLSSAMDDIPEDEDALIAQVAPTLDPAQVRLDQYGLALAR